MTEDEMIPVLNLTDSSKRTIALMSGVVGLTAAFLSYKATTYTMNEVLKDVGTRLYKDLGVVMKRKK